MKAREWLENKLKGTIVAGIEIQVQGERMDIHYVIAEKKRSKIGIASAGNYASIKELKLPKGIPACVSISGKGIIHKRTACSEETKEAELLNRILPNAKPEELFVQHTAPFEGFTIASAARKNYINELIDELTSQQIEVISFTLGPFGIAALLPALDLQYSDKLILPGHTLTITDDHVTDHKPNNEQQLKAITIGDEQIDPTAMVPFASALSYFTGSVVSVNIPLVTQQADELVHKRIFKFSVAVMLVVSFTILLGNYFVFDHYWKEKQAIESQAVINTDAVKRYEKLRAEHEEKISFLARTGLTQLSRASFYADRIGASVPGSIQLTEIDIAPRSKQAEENKISFETGTIRISGSCRHSSELNEWIKAIKGNSWVSEVELINYKQGKADPAGEFTIGIATR